MGYTHYWYRLRKYSVGSFKKLVEDFRPVVAWLEFYNVPLKGGRGQGNPKINSKIVAFNGDENCGHEGLDLGIAWASDDARGISTVPIIADGWFAGKELMARSCDGDCSHETFYFPRVLDVSCRTIKRGKYFFDCCKTAFKPYDLAVTTFLVLAKYHFEDDIIISSDGQKAQWSEAIAIVRDLHGYDGFDIDEEKAKARKVQR